MAVIRVACGAFLLAALVALAAPVAAQSYGPDQIAAPVAAPVAPEELDALVAPIALYPDELLAQVLMAATFPLDVVEAARFLRERPDLRGPALDDALAGRRWDPSVLSLAAYPQVLDMMSEHLDWTRRLGEVFLQDQAAVMQAVQDLRGRAQSAGTLANTPEQRVIVQDRAIMIEPAQPDIVYVPVYDPTIVYGPWWAPAYVPFYWRPNPYYYPGVIVTTGVVGFGFGYAITADHWHWARPDWHGHHIAIDVDRHNRFVDRRPGYREWARDGRWHPEPYRSQAGRDLRRGDYRASTPAPGATRAPTYRGGGDRGAYRGEYRGQSAGAPGTPPRALAAPERTPGATPRADWRTGESHRRPPPAGQAATTPAPQAYRGPAPAQVGGQASVAERRAPPMAMKQPNAAAPHAGAAHADRREGVPHGQGQPHGERGGNPRER